jgi:hypothetical protein
LIFARTNKSNGTACSTGKGAFAITPGNQSYSFREMAVDISEHGEKKWNVVNDDVSPPFVEQREINGSLKMLGMCVWNKIRGFNIFSKEWCWWFSSFVDNNTINHSIGSIHLE